MQSINCLQYESYKKIWSNKERDFKNTNIFNCKSDSKNEFGMEKDCQVIAMLIKL